MSADTDKKEEKIQDVSEDQSIKKTEVKVEEEKPATSIIRIPWREFIRNQFGKLVGTIIILGLMVWIIELSDQISPVTSDDPNSLNPDSIITTQNNVNVQLMLLSTIVFVAILIFFSKLVFFDHKEDFGIESYKSIRAVLFLLLTFSFISLIFILFDVALTKVYLNILPVYGLWQLGQTNIDFFYIEWISEGTDRLAYSDIRGLIFLTLFSFMLSFPLVMTIIILTRFGRQQLKERKERPRKKYTLKDWMRFFATLPFEFLLLSIFFAIQSLNPSVPIQFIVLLIFILIGIWWVIQLIILLFRALKTTSFLIYSNFAMIVPIVFLFYILPALIWSTWDLFVIFTSNDLSNTIYDLQSVRNDAAINPETTDVRTLSQNEVLEFYYQTFLFNLSDFFRIIELDFVFIIGLSSIVLGFAEGYSVVAIVRSITTGVSIAKTGRVASRSAPKMVVLSTRLVLLLTWMSLLYDKFTVLYNTLAVQLNIDLPELSLPRLFEFLFGISVDLQDLGGIFLALSLLVVPLYFIITSSFKFLSVSIVAEKAKNDTQAFFFLISSAFILIVTQILADIAALPAFLSDGAHYEFLPLQGINIPETFIPFISKIFEALEAIGFYGGAILSLFILLKLLILKIFRRR